MPFSLRIIKELSTHGIMIDSVKELHFIDLKSLLYSFRIDDGLRYLKSKNEENLQKRGISKVTEIEGSDILKYIN